MHSKLFPSARSNAVAQSFGRKTMRFEAYVAQAMRPAPNLSAALAVEGEDSWYLCNSMVSSYDRQQLLGDLFPRTV